MIPKREHPHKVERKTDRVVVLKTLDGKKALSSKGLVDPRLFNGENEVHIVKNPENNLWSIKYKMGGVPEPLKGSFTGFDRALNTVEKYFAKRNIEIDNVID